jgi:hypothetical protein
MGCSVRGIGRCFDGVLFSVVRVLKGGVSCVFDRVIGKELARCPFVCKVPLGRVRSTDVDWSWLRCSVDGGHCGFRGCRLKFESFGVDSLRVIWVCPKIVDLSFLKGDVHG